MWMDVGPSPNGLDFSGLKRSDPLPTLLWSRRRRFGLVIAVAVVSNSDEILPECSSSYERI